MIHPPMLRWHSTPATQTSVDPQSVLSMHSVRPPTRAEVALHPRLDAAQPVQQRQRAAGVRDKRTSGKAPNSRRAGVRCM